MSDQVFQEAYDRVRNRFRDREWFSMTPRQITEAIYKEIRLIDQERLPETLEEGMQLAAE
jgi:hypothetical protein